MGVCLKCLTHGVPSFQPETSLHSSVAARDHSQTMSGKISSVPACWEARPVSCHRPSMCGWACGVFVQELSDEEVFRANTLGWCIELVSAECHHLSGLSLPLLSMQYACAGDGGPGAAGELQLLPASVDLEGLAGSVPSCYEPLRWGYLRTQVTFGTAEIAFVVKVAILTICHSCLGLTQGTISWLLSLPDSIHQA